MTVMNLVYRQFFGLLIAGIWNVKPDVSLYENKVDWKLMLDMAKQHAVLGWVYDGILLLPKDVRPERSLMLRWFAVVANIERANVLLNSRIEELFHIYSLSGIKPILLKGQGLFSLYNDSLHRQAGDIDVYVGEDFSAIADKILTDDGAENLHPGHEEDKHQSFRWRDVVVENHKDIVGFFTRRYSDSWRAFVNRDFDGNFEKKVIGQTDVYVPTPYFNSIYLLIHVLEHLMYDGVGLRQICDFMTTIRTYGDKFDKEKWLNDIKSFGLLKPYCIFAYIGVNCFGMSKTSFPCYDDKVRRDAEMVLGDIFKGGNFGRIWSSQRFVAGSRAKRSYYLFIWLMRRYPNARRVYPVEARNKMLKMLWLGVKNTFHRVFHK